MKINELNIDQLQELNYRLWKSAPIDVLFTEEEIRKANADWELRKKLILQEFDCDE